MFLASRLSAALFFAPLLAAQTTAPPVGVQTQPAPLVLDVTVTNKSGVPVPNLQSSDFSVFADKVPQPILAVHAVDTMIEPLSVILVLDAVNTSYQEIGYERGQIEKFLSASEGRLAHPTTLAVLTDKGLEIQNGFTEDGNALRAAFDNYDVSLRTITRSTGVYGAEERVNISLTGLTQLAGHVASRPGRKVVLFLSPGWPLLSGANVQLDNRQQQAVYRQVVQMSTLLRTSRIALYAIDPYGAGENLGRSTYYQSFLAGLRKPSSAALGDLSLQVLAVESGGLAFNSTGIAELLSRCVGENSHFYRIAIAAPPADRADDYKSLQIKLSDASLSARTISGIYAQP